MNIQLSPVKSDTLKERLVDHSVCLKAMAFLIILDCSSCLAADQSVWSSEVVALTCQEFLYLLQGGRITQAEALEKLSVDHIRIGQ